MLANAPGEGSPEFRQLALELLQTERSDLERQSEHDGVSPAVAERAIRDLWVREADASQ
jgi:hypothetical protein